MDYQVTASFSEGEPESVGCATPTDVENTCVFFLRKARENNVQITTITVVNRTISH